MDLGFITDLYIPIVLVICLCVGFVFKKWVPADDKWIPTIMLILGAVLGCVANQEITLMSIGAGAVTGLASTGLHQVFKQLIDGSDFEVEEDLDDVELPDTEEDIEEDVE